MDEETDENKTKLSCHVREKAKDEFEQEDSPVIGPHDVIPLHHHSDSCNREKNDELESPNPVDARHLNSVYQYTSKIRQFIGLEDPKQNDTGTVPSPENETVNDESEDSRNLNSKNIDAIDEKLSDLHEDKNNESNLAPENNGDLNPSDIEENSDVNEHVKYFDENNKVPDVDAEVGKPLIAEEDEDDSDLSPKFNDVPSLNNPSGIVDIKDLVNSLGENNKESEVDADVEKSLIGKSSSGNGLQTSEPISNDEGESQTVETSGNNKITVVDVPTDNDEPKSLLNEIRDHNLTFDAKLAQTDAHTEQFPDLIEVSDLEMNPDAPIINFVDKTDTPLLRVEEIKELYEGVDLNEQDDILKDENKAMNCEHKINDETNSDLDISEFKNKDKILGNSDESENSKIFTETNLKFSSEDEQSTYLNENSNNKEDNTTSNPPLSEKKVSSVTPDEIENTPQFEHIRRMSVEIINKVLDTAGTQLRYILNEKRSYANGNNLQPSSDIEVSYVLHEQTAKISNNDSKNISADDDKNKSTIPGSDASQIFQQNLQQPEAKLILNNDIQLKEVLAKTYDSNDFQKKIEVEMNKLDPKYDVDPDVVCGIGCFKPRWIQPWATARVYLILYSIIGILSGSYYSYLIGAMSTLEKRFAFKSKTSGLVMTLDEVTPLVLGIFIGYYGGKSHRPRMVGFGMLLSSICCFISALPYFIYGPAAHLSLSYSDNEKKLELCNADTRKGGSCDDEDSVTTLTPILLLMLGNFFKGFGNLAYYAVGLAYMDDNSKKKNTPMYFAIAFSLRLLGPMVGFLMSSFFLKYYENPFVDPGFEPSDPRWIGCWWLGFLVQGVLLFIFTIPISLFPRRLPGTVDYTASRSDNDHHLATSFDGLFAALKRLAKNPVFVLVVLNAVMGIYGSFGHYINLPRYMENQFGLSASTSNLISAPPSIGATMVSMTIGGYLIWRFKPGAKFLAAVLCASQVIQTGTYFILMIPSCQRAEMSSYGFNDEGLILQSECNRNCNCTTSSFSPVCGPDGATMFFSPCHAGCSEKVNGTYWNCSCVSDSSGLQRDYATDGFCINEDCWPGILVYIITMPVVQLFVNLVRVAHTMIFLRSIKPEDKSVALGTFETIICAFGFIPYPIVYGALVDSACLIWEKSCGETGNCWYYDVPKLNYSIHGASALFSAFDALTLLGIVFLSAKVHDLYKDDSPSDVDSPHVGDKQKSQCSTKQ